MKAALLLALLGAATLSASNAAADAGERGARAVQQLERSLGTRAAAAMGGARLEVSATLSVPSASAPAALSAPLRAIADPALARRILAAVQAHGIATEARLAPTEVLLAPEAAVPPELLVELRRPQRRPFRPRVMLDVFSGWAGGSGVKLVVRH